MSIIKNYLRQNKVTHTFSSCQWPIGDPQEKDFHFCDTANVVGKPYCQQHCDLAYIDERELKKEKEVAILSPAAASLDQFNSYKERGEIFKKLVNSIK